MANHKSSPDESQAPISRVPRTRDQARRYYDRLSSIYDWLAGSEWKYTRQAVNLLALQPGERSLEIGFGTGRALVEMAQAAGQSGCTHGTDISRGMLAVARDKLKGSGVSQQACLLIGDALQLPYASACMDAILMSFTLELFDTPEIPFVLVECRRVLKPTGRLAIAALSKTEQPGLVARAYEWGHAHFPTLLDCRPIFLSAALRSAGFQVMKQQDFELYGLPVSIVLAGLPSGAA